MKKPGAEGIGLKRRCSLLAVAWLVSGIAFAAAADTGPYVVRGAEGWEAWSLEEEAGAVRKRVIPLAANATLTVPAVGELPAFKVKLRPPAPIARDALSAPAKAPLFVVADTHGEFEILVRMLRAHGVIDERLRWKFGRGHLVVLGDVFDRGPNHTEILWLLYQLEAEAHKAGGGSHLVLGNHETMVMRADLRYLNPKYRQTAALLGIGSYAELFDARSVLGQWLRSRPAVFRFNRYLCVHGGISRALVDRGLTLADINASVRSMLVDAPPAGDAARERGEFLMATQGPLWYRGYFPEHTDFPTATMPDVDLALEHFRVDRILIGHTIVPTITPLYDGKVIAVQVYPKRDESGQANLESLVIRDGEMRRALIDGATRPLE